jgi:NADPH-dependent 2,4-dienoyl-CoA reductase/sulfur reductase-like enzyme
LIFNNLQPIGVGVVVVVGPGFLGLATSIDAHTEMK